MKGQLRTYPVLGMLLFLAFVTPLALVRIAVHAQTSSPHPTHISATFGQPFTHVGDHQYYITILSHPWHSSTEVVTITVGNILTFNITPYDLSANVWSVVPDNMWAGTYPVTATQGSTTVSTSVSITPTLTAYPSITGTSVALNGERHDDSQGILITLLDNTSNTSYPLGTIAPQVTTTPFSFANVHMQTPSILPGHAYYLEAEDIATGNVAVTFLGR